MNIKEKINSLLGKTPEQSLWESTKNSYQKYIYKIKNLYETNLILGIKHYYNGCLFDANLRFNLILLFKKNDLKALENLALVLYRLGKQSKLMQVLNKIKTIESHNIIASLIENKNNPAMDDNTMQIIPQQIYENLCYYNYSLLEDIAEENRYNYFLSNGLNKYLSPESFVNHLDINCNLGENTLTVKRFFRTACSYGLDYSTTIYDICCKLTLYNRRLYDDLWCLPYQSLDVKRKFHIITLSSYFDFNCQFINIFKEVKEKILEARGYIYFVIHNHAENKDWIFNNDLDIFCYSHRFICDALNDLNFEILEVKHTYEESNFEDEQRPQIRKLFSSQFFVRLK